jgi:hypothetical protein
MSQYYVITQSMSTFYNRKAVYYMDCNGSFLSQNSEDAEKFPEKYGWILDYIVQDWNKLNIYNEDVFYEKILISGE